MKIKPLSFETPAEVLNKNGINKKNLDPTKECNDAINDILVDAGVISNSNANSLHDPNEELKKHFNDRGGSLEDIAQQVVNLMCRGENESVKLNAAKFIASIQGVKSEIEDAPTVKDVTINIIGSEGSQNRNFVNFVMPQISSPENK